MSKFIVGFVGFVVIAGCAVVVDDFTNKQVRKRIADELRVTTTQIPDVAIPTLQQGLFYCETRNQGLSDQHMTCWIPNSDASLASLALFGPASRLSAVMFGPAGRAVPDRAGGTPITDFIELGGS